MNMIPNFIFILTCLLAVGFLGVRFATWLRIPHSVFLVLLGIVSGLIFRSDFPYFLEVLRNYFPQIILYILLPPLVFESAFQLPLSSLKKDIVPITALAVVALVASTVFVGFGLYYEFGLALLPCLTFGALISATDPVAVVALFREVGAPIRLSTLIEGESLLNDGTAMVLFRIFMAATLSSLSSLGSMNSTIPGPTTAHSISLLSVIGEFCILSFGSIVLGFVLAWLTSLLLRVVTLSAAAQLGMMVVAAYLSFLIAEHFLHLSGVMCTLMVGLYLGQRVRFELNKEAFEGIFYILESLALGANTLVFLAVGLAFDPAWIVQNLHFIPLTLFIVYLARALSIVLTIPTTNRMGFSLPIPISYQVVLMWGGLRGGLALGLVLTLPEDFPHKDVFISLAVSVVLATLIVNALTTGNILKLLKLDQLSTNDERFFQKSFERIQDTAYSALKRYADSGLSLRMIQQFQVQFGNLKKSTEKSMVETDVMQQVHDIDLQFEMGSLLSSEQQTYEARFAEGALSKAAYSHLLDAVTFRRLIFDQEGIIGIRSHDIKQDINISYRLSWLEKWMFFFPSRAADRLVKKLVAHLEFLLHFKAALEASQEATSIADLKEIYQRWIDEIQNALSYFYRQYSHYYKTVQTLVISQSIYAISYRMLENLYESKIISLPVYMKLKHEFGHTYNETKTLAKSYLRPSAAYLLSRIPIFQNLSRVSLRTLAEASPVHIVNQGRILVREGEHKPVMFVIVAGVLKRAKSAMRPESATQLFFSGDFFGIRSLLQGESQSATLIAEVTTEVLEITRSNFDFIFDAYPYLKSKILSEGRFTDSTEKMI